MRVKIQQQKRRRKNKPNMKRKPTIRSLDHRIQKLNRDIELKYYDATQAALTWDDVGDLFLLNGMGQGTSQITRIGGEIGNTSIQWRMRLTTATGTLTGVVCRYIIFWDRQSNGVAPTISGSATGGTPALLNTAFIPLLINAPYQYETQERFKILFDKTFTLNPQESSTVTPATGITTTMIPVVHYERGKLQLSRRTKFDNNVAGIGSINTNALYMLVLSDQSGAAGNVGPSGDFGWRLYFKDG